MFKDTRQGKRFGYFQLKKNSLFQGQQSELKERRKQGVWASHNLLLCKPGWDFPPGKSGATGQQRDDFGGAGVAAAGLV